MAHFYRKMLEESEQKHEETVAATLQAQQKKIQGPQGPAPNLTITKPLNFVPQSDLELARLAKAQGKDVELNDDNQIVDKRDLLSAGLNLSAPNTRLLGLRTSVKKVDTEKVEVHRAAGTAASRQEINQRRKKEIFAQMEDEQHRILKEKQQREEEAAARLIARRNDDEAIQSAVERYRQRKRQKLEQTASEGVS